MPTAVLVLLAACLGACIGSFLNVVLWRVPRGESIVHPPSHCPNCGHELGPLELIPVLSWVALRGRCRTCRTHISPRYPLVELAVALVFGIVAWLVVG
jgi:leader peptidase (prepilin peptidase)/N-methyltransferase